MIEYREELIKSKILETVTCDVCKSKFSYVTDRLETQEFQHLSVSGGYDSIFGDGVKLKADICQHCFKKIFGQYLTEYEDGY